MKSFGPFRYYNECRIEDENIIAHKNTLRIPSLNDYGEIILNTVNNQSIF